MSRVINESEKRITCGWQGYKGHNGVDLGWRADETQNNVYANSKGTVIDVKDGLDTLPLSAKSWGNYVLVEHANGMKSRYAHLRKGTVRVNIGQSVDENTVLGIIGESGSVNGRHLHFEVYNTSNVRIDPTEYLSKPIYEEVVDNIPSVESNVSTSNEEHDFRVGDKVLVLSGYATGDSYGGGDHTAEYDGNINDSSNVKYITKIAEGNPRPYHLSNGTTLGDKDRGWVSKEQIKKI